MTADEAMTALERAQEALRKSKLIIQKNSEEGESSVNVSTSSSGMVRTRSGDHGENASAVKQQHTQTPMSRPASLVSQSPDIRRILFQARLLLEDDGSSLDVPTAMPKVKVSIPGKKTPVSSKKAVSEQREDADITAKRSTESRHDEEDDDESYHSSESQQKIRNHAQRLLEHRSSSPTTSQTVERKSSSESSADDLSTKESSSTDPEDDEREEVETVQRDSSENDEEQRDSDELLVSPVLIRHHARRLLSEKRSSSSRKAIHDASSNPALTDESASDDDDPNQIRTHAKRLLEELSEERETELMALTEPPIKELEKPHDGFPPWLVLILVFLLPFFISAAARELCRALAWNAQQLSLFQAHQEQLDTVPP